MQNFRKSKTLREWDSQVNVDIYADIIFPIAGPLQSLQKKTWN